MTILNDVLKSSPNLVNDLALKVVAESDTGMGSHVDLEGKNVIIRMARDRDEIDGEIGSVFHSGEFWPFEFIAYLLDLDYRAMRNDCERGDPAFDAKQFQFLSKLIHFLVTNYAAIEERFAPERIGETRRK